MKKWNVENFNDFKKEYESYTFSDKVEINKKIGKMFPGQSNWNYKSCVEFINEIAENNLKIVELGSWDGGLAEKVITSLPKEKISLWEGYDIPGNKNKIFQNKKFNLYSLNDYFWKQKECKNYDLFIASHTLEHFDIKELKKLVSFLSSNKIKYIYSDTPILQNWKNTWNTHVLEISKKEFENIFLSSGYVKIKETGPHKKHNYRQLYQYVGSNVFIHETAIVDKNVSIGNGTKVWAFSHISEGAKIGKSVNIGENVFIDKGVVIGDNCKIQNNSLIYKGVQIEENVFIGPNVVTTNDILPDISDDWCSRFKKTLIKKNSSIGANATIICGNNIEENCLIGAGAVVTKTTEKDCIYVGNPAKFLRKK